MHSTVPPPKKRKPDPFVGTVVNGKFRVDALVASGGMGSVYRAQQIALDRPVALKVLHAPGSVHGGSTADDPHFEKRFFREASILARLQHPNIVTVFDHGAIEGQDEERYFMALEFLSGETLGERIGERKGLGSVATVRIGRQIAQGLTEAHAQGVVHRDLKPSNVMLVPRRDGDELVKVLDFGIVKILGEADTQELTQEGSFVGSPRYMAPEQIDESARVDARCDIYSFGIILYECLTGRVPFDASTSMKTLMAHLNEAPAPLRGRGADPIPTWLDDLVMRCIEKAPGDRPQSMDLVARALLEGEATLSGDRSTAGGPLSVGRTPASRAAGETERGTIATLHPPPGRGPAGGRSTASDRRASPVALGLAIVATGLAVALFVVARSKDATVAPAAAPLVSAASAPGQFLLTLTSIPSGAEVREGDRSLGATPLELPVDNLAAAATPRRFVVLRAGFEPFELAQGPSPASVRVVANLVELPAPSAAPVVEAGVTRKSVVAPRLAPSAAPTASGLDIRLSR